MSVADPRLNLTACHLRQVRWVLPELACDQCGQLAARVWEAERVAIDIHLDHPVLLVVQVSVHHCPACQHYFRAQPPFLRPDASYTNRVVEKAVQSVFADGMAFRRVPERLARDFWVQPSEKMVRLWCRRHADGFDLARDYQPWVVSEFSGILCVDEVYQDRLALLLAVDPAAPEGDRLVGYQLVHGDKVTPADITGFLERLKQAGIMPDQLITDGSTLYPRIVAAVWPQAAHQLCLFHQTRLVTEAAKQVIKAIFAELPRVPRTPSSAAAPEQPADDATGRRSRRGRLYQHQQQTGRRLVHQLRDQGATISAIARQLGLSRMTVRKWLRQPPPEGSEAAPVPELPVRVDRTLPPDPPPDPWQSWEQVQQVRQATGPDRLRLLRHPDRLTEEDQATLADLDQSPVGEPVGRARAFVEEWYAIWRDEQGHKRARDDAQQRYDTWRTNPAYQELAPLRRMQGRTDAEQFTKLSQFLEQPDWEGTNNGAERMGRLFRQRQGPHFRLRTAAGIDDDLTMHALARKTAHEQRHQQMMARSRRGRRPRYRR